MAGLSRFLASANWQRTLTEDPGGRFIPNMEKFITDGLYLDYPTEAPEETDDGYISAEEATRRMQAEIA